MNYSQLSTQVTVHYINLYSPSGRLGQYGAILLDHYICPHSAGVTLRAALLVLDHEAVRCLQGAPLTSHLAPGPTLSSLH